MFGYVYITTNNINGKKYIGQHRSSDVNDNYLGSGTILKRAFKKHGKSKFSKVILGIADTQEELNNMEKYFIAKHQAVLSESYYNLRDGGGHGPETPTEFIPNRAISKKGRPTYFTPEGLANMIAKRKAQIAMGIGVPPPANRGNKDFRHTDETLFNLKEQAVKLHEKKKIEGRSYWSENGRKNITNACKNICSTKEKLKIHSDKIKQGKEKAFQKRKEDGIETLKIIWFHDPNEPTNRIKISVTNGKYDADSVPFDWVRGFGVKGKRKGPAPKTICKPCSINGIEYTSAAEAGRNLGIHPDTVSFRLKSNNEKWKTWINVTPDRKNI